MTNEQFANLKLPLIRPSQARAALPGGTDAQLIEWVIEHYPSFPPDIEEALAKERIKDLIRERARELGITLKE